MIPLWILILFAAAFGLAIGSFLNVLIFRTHEDVPLTGRSKCLKCEEPIEGRDLIPVLSYFLLRGRCRSCEEEISWQYPAVEAATGILFAFLAATMTDPALFLRGVIFTIFLIIIFVYDLRYHYILDRFTLPAMILAAILNIASNAVSVPSMLIGGAVIGGFFLIQHVVSKGKWVGGGDVRMGVVMGLMLGWQNGLVALFLAYALGAFVGIALILTRRLKMGSQVPFGTFLALGTFIALLWGQPILDWYLRYFA